MTYILLSHYTNYDVAKLICSYTGLSEDEVARNKHQMLKLIPYGATYYHFTQLLGSPQSTGSKDMRWYNVSDEMYQYLNNKYQELSWSSRCKYGGVQKPPTWEIRLSTQSEFINNAKYAKDKGWDLFRKL